MASDWLCESTGPVTCPYPLFYLLSFTPGCLHSIPLLLCLRSILLLLCLRSIPLIWSHLATYPPYLSTLKMITPHALFILFGTCMYNRPYSHKLLIINNYVNCPPNFGFARLIHRPIFEKILMRIRSIPCNSSFEYTV